MAELGETSVPRELIPGSPEDVDSDVDKYRNQARTLETVGHDLGRINVGSWVGQASEIFRETFVKEPPKWFRISDSLDSTATALSDYSDTLRWAQSQGQEAIRLWEEGEKATREALAAHQAAIASAKAGAVAGDTDTSAPEFTDPGEEKRRQAQELLGRARKQLDEAGATASGRIESDAMSQDFEGPSTDFQFGGPSWKIDGREPNAGLGSFMANFQLFEYSSEAGPTFSYGGFDITPQVSAWVGGKEDYGMNVTKDGLEFDYSYFVGAQVGAGVTGEAAGVDYEGSVEYWVGYGYATGADVQVKEDGTVVVDGEWGIAPRGWGVGGEVHVEVPPEVVAEGVELATEAGEKAEEAFDAVKDRFTWG